MRWFGPHDSVRLIDLRQAGIEGIVTALHEIPVGEVWTISAIQERQKLLAEYNLVWSVVESLPVHEDIKKGKENRDQLIKNYQQNLRNLAACGVHVVTYNFMPILDWIRTDPHYKNPDGTETLAYIKRAFIYFDLALLKRPNAHADYNQAEIDEALDYGSQLSEAETTALFKQILLGLPGSQVDFTAEEILSLLKTYEGITSEVMRENLIYFLSAVAPVAEEVGVKMAIHPDDPPFSLLGLPRIMSTAKDAELLFNAVPSVSNGLCYCTGSFGAHPKNDLVSILKTNKERIHFVHLRNVTKSPNGDFKESEHLNGDNPMEEVMEQLLLLCQERNTRLPMRPDHGFLHEIEKGTKHYPGYSLIGRMKALAELSGLELGILNKLKRDNIHH